MATTNPIDAYVKKVSYMRHEQKEYFKTRNYQTLQRAKALEKEVDAMTLTLMNRITTDGSLISNESQNH